MTVYPPPGAVAHPLYRHTRSVRCITTRSRSPAACIVKGNDQRSLRQSQSALLLGTNQILASVSIAQSHSSARLWPHLAKRNDELSTPHMTTHSSSPCYKCNGTFEHVGENRRHQFPLRKLATSRPQSRSLNSAHKKCDIQHAVDNRRCQTKNLPTRDAVSIVNSEAATISTPSWPLQQIGLSASLCSKEACEARESLDTLRDGLSNLEEHLDRISDREQQQAQQAQADLVAMVSAVALMRRGLLALERCRNL